MAEAFEFSRGVRYTHRMFIPWCTDTNLGYIFNFSSKFDILHYNKIYSVIYRWCGVGIETIFHLGCGIESFD